MYVLFCISADAGVPGRNGSISSQLFAITMASVCEHLSLICKHEAYCVFLCLCMVNIFNVNNTLVLQ